MLLLEVLVLIARACGRRIALALKPFGSKLALLAAAFIAVVAGVSAINNRIIRLENEFAQGEGRKCTGTTRGYPAHTFTIYTVDAGKRKFVRIDHYISNANRAFIILSEDVAYLWNTWGLSYGEGQKFPAPSMNFREYLGRGNIELTCEEWAPDRAQFSVPANVSFVDGQAKNTGGSLPYALLYARCAVLEPAPVILRESQAKRYADIRAYWDGQCKDGFAHGEGSLVWFRNRSSFFEEEIKRGRGIVMDSGTVVAAADVVGSAVRWGRPKCTRGHERGSIVASVSDDINLAFYAVAGNLLHEGVRRVQRSCGGKGDGRVRVWLYHGALESLNVFSTTSVKITSDKSGRLAAPYSPIVCGFTGNVEYDNTDCYVRVNDATYRWAHTR